MIREILLWPDRRLGGPSNPVVRYGQELWTLLDDMAETMHNAGGAGLAAIQVGVPLRAFVLAVENTEKARREHVELVNPLIRADLLNMQVNTEGCLSLPGVFLEVRRSLKVSVTALDRYGKEFEVVGEGLLAAALQHEYDHLLGITIMNRADVGDVRRDVVRRRMAKLAANSFSYIGRKPVIVEPAVDIEEGFALAAAAMLRTSEDG